MVSDGLTPKFAVIVEPSTMCIPDIRNAVVGIDHSNISVGADHAPSDEVGCERRVDVFENTRTGNAADLVLAPDCPGQPACRWSR